MDIRKLRYFVAVAEEGQISRAARRLHMSAPPLGQQIKLLEEEIGTPLLNRKGHSMSLTKSGELLYLKAVSLINQFEETITEVKETGEGLRGELSIGTLVSCTPYLSKTMSYFNKNYPHVLFTLSEGAPSYLCTLLDQNKIEIAFIRSLVDMEKYSMINLKTEPFVLVIPLKWRKKFSNSTVLAHEFANLPLLLLQDNRDKGFYEIIINECRNLGFEPNVICKTPNATIILSLVNEGVGATILPLSAINLMANTNIKIMEILDFSISSNTAVLWSKERLLSKSAQRFINIFKDFHS